MLQHGARQQIREKDNSTVQRLTDSRTAYFGCFRVLRKRSHSEVKSLNLSLVCLRVFASFIGIAGAARTPSVGRRAHAASGCKPEFSQPKL